MQFLKDGVLTVAFCPMTLHVGIVWLNTSLMPLFLYEFTLDIRHEKYELRGSLLSPPSQTFNLILPYM